MKTRLTKLSPKCKVGDVVHVGLHEVDQTKVDGNTITGVPDEILKIETFELLQNWGIVTDIS